MPGLVRPHGGSPLKPLALTGEALAAERARARSLPAIRVSSREKGDLVMLGIGGFTPLDGFMTKADWQGTCDAMKLADGLFWPIPITLSADDAAAARLTSNSTTNHRPLDCQGMHFLREQKPLRDRCERFRLERPSVLILAAPGACQDARRAKAILENAAGKILIESPKAEEGK